MGGVVVAAVEDAHGVGVGGGQGFEELDEALLIVDLEVLGLRMRRVRVGLTFSSGRFDMTAVLASWIGSVYLLFHTSISSWDFEMVGLARVSSLKSGALADMEVTRLANLRDSATAFN